jgi:hypothetical protein
LKHFVHAYSWVAQLATTALSCLDAVA